MKHIFQDLAQKLHKRATSAWVLMNHAVSHIPAGSPEHTELESPLRLTHLTNKDDRTHHSLCVAFAHEVAISYLLRRCFMHKSLRLGHEGPRVYCITQVDFSLTCQSMLD